MGKNFCKVEWKWCKHLKHNGVCSYCNSEAEGLSVCPRIKEIETVRFYDAVMAVEFDKVSPIICKMHDQERNIDGYEKVFNTIRSMTPRRHKLTDLFIRVEKLTENGEDYLDVDGVDVFKNDGRSYGLELSPWVDWISMFITKETLDNLTYEEIVAACLFEMTFFGFTEDDITKQHEKMIESFKELRERN